MIYFLDSSCFVRKITSDGSPILDWSGWERIVASAIVRVEVARTFNRLRIEGGYDDVRLAAGMALFAQLATGIDWVPISDAILELASEPTVIHLKALDAIHLASARSVRDASRERVVFATHDRRLAAAAASFGFEVVGV